MPTLRDVGRSTPFAPEAPINLAAFILPAAIDPLLVIEFVAYGVAILLLQLSEEVLTRVRIGDAWAISYARAGIAVLLLLSAFSETIVSVAMADGRRCRGNPERPFWEPIFESGEGNCQWTGTSHPDDRSRLQQSVQTVTADLPPKAGLAESAEGGTRVM